jgi:hypothetical protein
MVGCGFAAGFFQGYLFFVFDAGLKNFPGCVPFTLGLLAEIPGMTLAAGKIASRLIDRKIILRAGKMDCGD